MDNTSDPSKSSPQVPKTPERPSNPQQFYSKSQPTTPNASSSLSLNNNNHSNTLNLPPPTTPTSHHHYQRRYARLHQSPLRRIAPSSSEKHGMQSPHATPPRSIEYQDRFMPARTPRSARMRLDFSDTDQGPLSHSPFQKSPAKSTKSNSSSGNKSKRENNPASDLTE